MFQACFDDSGKTQMPVYVLAGFISRVRRWQVYSHEWDRVLKRPPEVSFLSTNEAFRQTGCFSGWSEREIEKRLLKLVEVIQNRVDGGAIFTLDHADYKAVMTKVEQLPFTPEELRKLRMLKNPFYFGFHTVVVRMLGEHAHAHMKEGLQILFDHDIDREKRLENGYRNVIEGIRKEFPEHVKLLVNKEAEFRDEKVFLPLQAADLLAWNVRRDRYEKMRGRKHRWKVWEALRKAVPYRRYHSSKLDIAKLMGGAANVDPAMLL